MHYKKTAIGGTEQKRDGRSPSGETLTESKAADDVLRAADTPATAGLRTARAALERATRHYREHGPENLDRLLALDSRFGKLIVDFPLVSRLAEFEVFCSGQRSLSRLSVDAIRDRFAASLPSVTCYRCLGLRRPEKHELGAAYQIFTRGIAPSYAWRGHDLGAAPSKSRVEVEGLAAEIVTRAEGKRASLLQGVSVYPEVAIQEGAAHTEKHYEALFLTLELPALTLIRPGAHGIKMGANLDELWKEDHGGRVIAYDWPTNRLEFPRDSVQFRPLDRDYELFLLGDIPPTAIRRAQWIPKEMIPSFFIPESWRTLAQWQEPVNFEGFRRLSSPPQAWLDRLAGTTDDIDIPSLVRQREAAAKIESFVRERGRFPETKYDPHATWHDRSRIVSRLKGGVVAVTDALIRELELIGHAEAADGMNKQVANEAFELLNRMTGEDLHWWSPPSTRCVGFVLSAPPVKKSRR